MKRSSAPFLYALVFISLNNALSFRTSDPDGRFKQVVEKKCLLKKPKFTIPDDYRFPNTISSRVIGARPLSESVKLKNDIRPRTLVPRKLFGIDKNPTEYWFHNQIHTFGNTNVFGGFHAAAAPFATWLIDTLAYDGTDVRSIIANSLSKVVNKNNAKVIDLCSGVGMSTRALALAFPDAEFIYGIDTSPEMTFMARFITNNMGSFNLLKEVTSSFKELGNGSDVGTLSMNIASEIRKTASTNTLNIHYAIGNAERVLSPEKKFDLVTIMYAFHEIPKSARARILREARRLLTPGGTLAIVDINPTDYVPSPSMLAGEPYVLEYKENIERQIENFQGFHDLQSQDVVPGLLKMWTLKRNVKSLSKDVEENLSLSTFSK